MRNLLSPCTTLWRVAYILKGLWFKSPKSIQLPVRFYCRFVSRIFLVALKVSYCWVSITLFLLELLNLSWKYRSSYLFIVSSWRIFTLTLDNTLPHVMDISVLLWILILARGWSSGLSNDLKRLLGNHFRTTPIWLCLKVFWFLRGIL